MAKKRKIVWITGAAGFSGGHLVRFLRTVHEPLWLVGIDVKPITPFGLDVYHKLDITNESKLLKLVQAEPPDRVIHLAGILPPSPEPDLWRVNVGGTLNLLHALADAKASTARFVTVGSAAEYTNFTARRTREDHSAGGNSPYGRTKWAQSTLALAFGEQMGMKVMVARTFNLIGPGTPLSLVPGALCAQFAAGQSEIKVGNLTPERDFIDIRDAVAAYWMISEKGKAGNIYNVCAGRPVSIQRLIEYFLRSVPNVPIIRTSTRSDEKDCVYGDNSKIRKTGWVPKIPIQCSVDDMLLNAHAHKVSSRGDGPLLPLLPS